jgi:hypothetical protein
LGDDIIQVKQYHSDETTTPSETRIYQHEERPNKRFLSSIKQDFGLKKNIPKAQLKRP